MAVVAVIVVVLDRAHDREAAIMGVISRLVGRDHARALAIEVVVLEAMPHLQDLSALRPVPRTALELIEVAVVTVGRLVTVAVATVAVTPWVALGLE